MNKSILIIAIIAISTFNSCNRKQNELKETISNAPITTTDATNVIESPAAENEQIPPNDQPPAPTDSLSKTPTPKLAANIDWDKKIIKTASLKLEVPDFNKYSSSVYKTVKQLGGYIAQEDQNLSAEKNETVITIKIPVYQFETMMNELPGADTKVLERKITSDDVTGKLFDTKSRLEAKKEMRLKYLEFLRQSKNMKEVLEVQNEVNNIQEEIEAAAGQVNFLAHQSAMSTINLTFFQMLSGYKPEVIVEPSFLTRIANAFKLGGAWLADLFVGMMSVWPLILLILAGIFTWKRIKSHRLSPEVIQSPEKNK